MDEIDQQFCPLALGLSEIGDAWSFLILREAHYGRERFSDFVTHTGAQKTVVSARLKRLIEAGLLRKEVSEDFPTRHRYVLTDKGRDLGRVLLALSEWGRKWAPDEAHFMVSYRHTCGELIEPVTHCGRCGEPATADTLTPEVAPPPA